MNSTGRSNWQTPEWAAIAVCVVLSTSTSSAFAQAVRTIGERFDSREPRVCADMSAPARGAITAAIALRYLNCQMDYVSGDTLYLVEDVTVQVGGEIPYAAIRGQRSFNEIDVRTPVYPIRGSLIRYQCSPAYRPLEPNCRKYDEPKASGYCYKTTFADWKCYMSDSGKTDSVGFQKLVAPPKTR